MPTFLTLLTETTEGESSIRHSVERASAFREKAREFDVTIRELRWAMGAYDGFILFDAPDSETACSLLHHLGSKGAVHTKTMQTFDAEQMTSILDRARL